MTAESSAMIRNAVERHSIASKKGILDRLFSVWFDGIVYTQIWEDPRVDAEALQLDSNSRIMTISSGGCNILNYLAHKPHTIHAVDLNQHHLNVANLKIHALKHLPSYDDFFTMFGHADKTEIVELYKQHIRPHLDEDSQAFWESGTAFGKRRINYFTDNFYHYGTMGFFIRLVHRLSRWFATDPKNILRIKDVDERTKFFETHFEPFFNHWLVKRLGQMPFLFYNLGIPPQQFRFMKEDCDGKLNELYLERMKRMICQFPIDDNYFAWQAYSLRYDVENKRAIPDYLKEEHYETIRSHLDRVHLHLVSTTAFLKTQPDNSLNGYILLDSQDWMNDNMITELWTEIARTGMPNGRVIFRTASAKSPIENALPGDLYNRFRYEEQQSKDLFQQDRSAIYGGFHIYTLQS